MRCGFDLEKVILRVQLMYGLKSHVWRVGQPADGKQMGVVMSQPRNLQITFCRETQLELCFVAAVTL